MDVAFETSDLLDAARAEFEDVLAGIRWAAPVPDRLAVLRQLAGGRSGARVLLVDVERPGGRVDRRVVKVDRADVVAREWTAFTTYLKDRSQASLTPVETGSDFVLNGQHEARPARPAALVYVDVAAYAVSDESAITFEDVVRQAFRSGDTRQAVALTSAVMQQLAGLHTPVRIEPRASTLRPLNERLGVDVVLEVDRKSAVGELSYGQLLDTQVEARRRYSGDVLTASTALRGQPRRPVDRGDVILLDDVVPRAIQGEEVIADLRDGVTVGIRAAQGAEPGLIRPELLGRPGAARAGPARRGWEWSSRCPARSRRWWTRW